MRELNDREVDLISGGNGSGVHQSGLDTSTTPLQGVPFLLAAAFKQQLSSLNLTEEFFLTNSRDS